MLCCASILFAVKHLGIDTNTEDMLSKDLPFRIAYARYKHAFPTEIDTVFIVVEAPTPEFADEATRNLAKRLHNHPLFKTIYLPEGGQFFEDNGLLYLDIGELEELTDNLAKAQPLMSRLARDRSLRGLFSIMGEALNAPVEGIEVALQKLLFRVSDAIHAVLSNHPYSLSWQELIRGENTNSDASRRFIVAQPELDFSELLPGQHALLAIRQIVRDLFADPNRSIRVRMTGDVALTYEEMESVSQGAKTATIVSLAAVFLTLFLALRSLRLVCATTVTLLAGLILTVGFATVAIGHLNLISVAFAVLYIGLGVDYAIHFNLRYSDLIRSGEAETDALRQSARDIGPSLVLCAISTAVGFLAFLPTAYTGVSELGLISGTGMVLSLTITLTFMPATLILLSGLGRKRGVLVLGSNNNSPLVHFPARFGPAICCLTLPLIIGSLWLLPKAKFDCDPMNLRNPDTESVSTFHDLIEAANSSPMTITALAPDGASASNLAQQLGQLHSVDKAVTIFDFIPQDQDEKLFLIEEIDLILGPQVSPKSLSPPPSTEEQIAASLSLLRQLDDTLKNTTDRAKTDRQKSVSRLSSSLRELLTSFESMDNDNDKNQTVSRLQRSLLESLPIALTSIRNAVKATTLTLSQLPQDLRKRWIGKDGSYRIEIFPKEKISEKAALQRFVSDVQSVRSDATGAPVIMLEAGNVVVRAFQQAFIAALIIIIAILILKFRNIIDPLFVILPLAFAGVFTVAAMVLLNIPFNFANIIALPLLFGLGVDNGIHMVHRIHKTNPKNEAILTTSTARGIFFSGLTTVFSFGSLAFMPHTGMATMGAVLAIGVFLNMICTLIILPAFLLTFRIKPA